MEKWDQGGVMVISSPKQQETGVDFAHMAGRRALSSSGEAGIGGIFPGVG